MSDRQVRDEILTLFVAGHETTATSLAWTLYYEWCFYAVFALTAVLLGPWAWAAAALVWLGSMAWAGGDSSTAT